MMSAMVLFTPNVVSNNNNKYDNINKNDILSLTATNATVAMMLLTLTSFGVAATATFVLRRARRIAQTLDDDDEEDVPHNMNSIVWNDAGGKMVRVVCGTIQQIPLYTWGDLFPNSSLGFFHSFLHS